jgi:hypothetical protein
MELFSARFRAVKRGERMVDEPFEYDVRSANPRLQPLVARLFEMEDPVFIQNLIRIETILSVAKEVVRRKIVYSSDDEFLGIASDVVVNQEEFIMLEICLRLMECVECFNVEKFCLAFARTREDEKRLMTIFSMRKFSMEPGSLSLTSRLNFFAVFNEEEEPGESLVSTEIVPFETAESLLVPS